VTFVVRETLTSSTDGEANPFRRSEFFLGSVRRSVYLWCFCYLVQYNGAGLVVYLFA
jgi:hypothetical protein